MKVKDLIDGDFFECGGINYVRIQEETSRGGQVICRRSDGAECYYPGNLEVTGLKTKLIMVGELKVPDKFHTHKLWHIITGEKGGYVYTIDDQGNTGRFDKLGFVEMPGKPMKKVETIAGFLEVGDCCKKLNGRRYIIIEKRQNTVLTHNTYGGKLPFANNTKVIKISQEEFLRHEISKKGFTDD